MKNKFINQATSSTVNAIAITLLLSLPGCKLAEWCSSCNKATGECAVAVPGAPQAGPGAAAAEPFVSADDTTEVLAYMDGVPLVTRGQIERLIETNPQLQQMRGMIDPAQLEFQLLQGLINKAVLGQYIRLNRIDKSAEYQKKLAEMIDSVRDMLNVEFFSQALPVSTAESEVKEFYESNKDKIPQLMVSRGGVKAACVHFDKEDDAQAFLLKVEAHNGDIKKAVEDAGLTGKFKDFMVINNQSYGYDAALRDKITAMENVPGTELCKVADGFYVVRASDKEAPTYQPYASIKKQLKDYLEGEKRKQVSMQELHKLTGTYNVTRSKAGDDIAQKVENAGAQEMPLEAMED